MKKVPDTVAITVYINFLDEIRAMLQTYSYDSEGWHKAHDRVITEVYKLKNVEEVGLDHQAYAKVVIDAKTWEGVGAEVDRARNKISKILERLKNKSGVKQ